MTTAQKWGWPPLWVPHDGGRAAAGYRSSANDCVVRAVAIAGQLPYREASEVVRAVTSKEKAPRRRRSSPRGGVTPQSTRRVFEVLGWSWVPTPGLRMEAEALPPGRLVVRLSHHVAAVVDGVLYDVFDCSRGGTRPIYGYWRRP